MSGREQHPEEHDEPREYSRMPPDRLCAPVFDGLVVLVPTGQATETVIPEPEEWQEPIVQRPLIDDQGRVLDYGPGN